ncbi:MAG TPA: hypothetical protein ENK09_02460 [Nitrospirae bacterium]|nr:hypothetical protein [Nitrospirota bacterium]
MKRIFIALIVLNTLAVLVLALDSITGRDYSRVAEFQRLTAGFGLGASVNPRWGFNTFDPRIDIVEETNLYPIAGGYIYSPSRGLTVSEFSETF